MVWGGKVPPAARAHLADVWPRARRDKAMVKVRARARVRVRVSVRGEVRL